MKSAIGMVVDPIDPGAGVEGALGAITGGVNDNLVSIMVVGGGLLAIGVVWALVRKFGTRH